MAGSGTQPEPPAGLNGVTATSAFHATVAVTVIMLLSHILGLFREVSMAAVFGAGAATDAYFVAFIIPSAIAGGLAGGIQAVATSLLGDYIYQENRRAELPVVAWSLFHMILLLVGAITIALIVCVPPCMAWLAPGFTPEQIALARRMTLVMSGVVFITGINAWCHGVLQAHQRFNPTAYGHATFNVVMIAAIFACARFGGIVGLAWGLLAAFLSITLLQWPVAVQLLPAYRLVMDLRHPCVRNMAVQMVPVSVRSVALTLNQIVERYLASKLVSGSISALEYANRAVQIPMNIFGGPVVTVLYSAMSAFRSGGDIDRYKRAFVRGVRMTALAFIPLSVGLVLFAKDIVRLLFERGAFDATATALTGPALIYFSVGLTFTIWRAHAIQALSALQDFTGPLYATLVATGVNVAANLVLVGPMAQAGIALGKSIGDAVCFFILYWMIRKRVGRFGGAEITTGCLKIALASALAAAGVHFARGLPFVTSLAALVETAMSGLAAGGAWSVCIGRAAALAVLGASYAALFVLFAKLLRVSETGELYDLLRNYFNSKLKRGAPD